ncbi:DUF6049 family protein [Labedella endophytica]|uniref:2-oxoglutarate dehydrogenase n=1 Tax=Labedella endophytica TaxID=1523160 RepID=A0A433JNU4_9MICO|nr:DUF6049 family protein [Labedella endophytica]RUQ98099.1 hypothetical protein ELQ94_13815 [Labedella endophytica]
MNSRLLKSLLRSLPATALVLAMPFVAAPALALEVSATEASATEVSVTGGVVRTATDDEADTATTDEPTVSIQIDSESASVEGDEPLSLVVTIDNTTDTDLDAGRIVLTGGSTTIGSRATLHAHLDGSDPLPTPVDLVDVAVPPITAGSNYTSNAVLVPNDRLSMPPDYGAVPLTAAFESGATTIAAHDTYIAAAAAPTNSIELAIAIPVTAPTGQNGLISSESLATYTAPSGVLTRQLDGAAGRDVALGVDPMIIASIRVLGAAAPASATAWLDRLADVPNETFPLQFADADGAVQAASGLDALLEPSSVQFALPADYTPAVPTETPTPDPSGTPTPAPTEDDTIPTVDELTAFEWTMDDLLWPAEGTVTASDLDMFAASGVTDTILGSSNVADATAYPAASTVGERGALVADDDISSALRIAATAVTAGDGADAIADISAELAVTAREQGATGRTVLATLDRGWPPTASRLGDALQAVSNLPTVNPVDLSDVRAEERIDVTLADIEPDSSRTSAVSLLMDREARLREFSAVLTTPELLTGRERVQILTLLSVDWMDTGEEWTEALVAHSEQTSELLGSVSILNSSDVLLVGNESAIPFGVRNDSPYDVQVLIDATPSNIRLDVGDPQVVEVAAGSRQTVRVPVTAQLGNGDVGLTVTLSSVSGVRVGEPVTATVAVRADWEGIGAVIAVLLVVGMLVAGVVRTILRRRARLAEAAEKKASSDAPDSDNTDSNGNIEERS